jgi:hypothetical protein
MSPQADNNLPPGKIEFIESHRPALTDGDYTITISQTVEAGSKISRETFPPVTKQFSVQGPRFNLDPQAIQAMFPPPGSLGEHSNVLPHIVFKRSTLPWERSAVPGDDTVPWLALLLFSETEAASLATSTLTWSALQDQAQNQGKFPKVFPRGTTTEDLPTDEPSLVEEYGQQPDDKLTVIEVDKQLLQAILPGTAELKWLAHVRQGKTEAGEAESSELAVIIGNRLPEPGQVSTVHLVSLEGRYRGDAFDDRQTGDTIRLISLKSWRLACVTQKQSFKGLLLHLNRPLMFNAPATSAAQTALDQAQIPDDLRQAFTESKHALSGQATVADRSAWQISDSSRRYLISANEANPKIYNQAGTFLFEAGLIVANLEPAQILATLKPVFETRQHTLSDQATIAAQNGHWWLQDSNQHYFISDEQGRLYVYHQDLDSTSTLRLPQNANPDAEKYLAMGCVPLPHAMRQGNRTISWYHGPLVPGQNTTKQDLQLPVRAADELVRYNPQLGLFDVSYAAAWELGRLLALQSKDFSVNLFNWKRTHAQQLKNAETQLVHLPFGSSTSPDLPATVGAWFERTARLEGVPFSYLAPDERLLPPESIRFFQVDWLWIDCLLDGAFSIGRVLASDQAQDESHATSPAANPHGLLSGFLLRSDVVAGWPDLQVDGYDQVIDDLNFIPDQAGLEVLRLARLSKNVLFCLFKGVVQTLDLHQKPEALHFGLNRPDDDHPGYYKELRDRTGLEQANLTTPVPWKNGDQTKRVVNIDGLAGDIKAKLQATEFTSAQFALEMIEGVEKVRFINWASSSN